MLDVFRKDFWAVSRENKGYYAWVNEYKYALSRTIRGGRCCRLCDEPSDAREQVDALLETGLSLHPLFDVAFDAISRAETRLSLRFVPQRSNEERLTGHLISEIEAAIHLASPSFTLLSQKRYGENLMLDFSYLDLSRGGHDEKLTGGDFGIILSIDLPDRPKILRSIAVQAKKLNRNSQVNKVQFDTLVKNYGEGATYIFYDMNFETLAPPLVINASNLNDARDKDEKTESFS